MGDVVRRAGTHLQRGGQAEPANRAGQRTHARLWLGLTAGLALATPAFAAAPPSVYKVAKYPVQAQAEDAVTAKAQALADAQQGAFRALMKRLVPVTAYKKLPRLSLTRIQDMIAGFSVRSERNSSTEYLGSYDFEFQARAVRELLRANGLPYIEEMAQPVVIVTAYGAPVAAPATVAGKGGKSPTAAAAGADPAALPAHLQAARAAPVWSKAWSDLDTEHTLTPARLAKIGGPIPEDTLHAALAGDTGALRGMAGSETNDRIVLAHAAPTTDGRKLSVTLVGRDAVGPFSVTRLYPVLDGDLGYATELAAVVGLGILEGRWKAWKSSRSPSSGSVSADGVDGWSTSASNDGSGRGDGISTSQPGGQPIEPSSGGGWSDDIELLVEFRGLGQWQQMRRRLTETPGVEDLEVGQMSARTAMVKLRFPGGPERLSGDLNAQGMQLSKQGGNWVLQAR